MERKELYLVPVPKATDSYAPVSHRDIVESVYEQLDKHNLKVANEYYKGGREGNQVIGYMDIKRDNNNLGMRIAFRNSYDKSMSVAFVAGSMVWICSNGMISGEMQFLRKHTGGVVKELNAKIVNTINQLDDHFNKMVEHSELMKQVHVDTRMSAELAGRLFIEEGILNTTQLNILKKEILEPSFDEFKGEDLWSFYNNTTYALKNSHPINYIDNHIQLHEFVEIEYGL